MAAEPFSASAIEIFFRRHEKARDACDKWSYLADPIPSHNLQAREQEKGSYITTYAPNQHAGFLLNLAYRPKPAPNERACNNAENRAQRQNVRLASTYTSAPKRELTFDSSLAIGDQQETPPDIFHIIRPLYGRPQSESSDFTLSSLAPDEIEFAKVDYHLTRPLTPNTSTPPTSPLCVRTPQSNQHRLTPQAVMQRFQERKSGREGSSSGGLSAPSANRVSIRSGSQYHRNSKRDTSQSPERIHQARNAQMSPSPVPKSSVSRIHRARGAQLSPFPPRKSSISRIQRFDDASPKSLRSESSNSSFSMFIGSDEEEGSEELNGAVVVDGNAAFVGLAFGDEIVKDYRLPEQELMISNSNGDGWKGRQDASMSQGGYGKSSEGEGEDGEQKQGSTLTYVRTKQNDPLSNAINHMDSTSTPFRNGKKHCSCTGSKECSRCRNAPKPDPQPAPQPAPEPASSPASMNNRKSCACRKGEIFSRCRQPRRPKPEVVPEVKIDHEVEAARDWALRKMMDRTSPTTRKRFIVDIADDIVGVQEPWPKRWRSSEENSAKEGRSPKQRPLTEAKKENGNEIFVGSQPEVVEPLHVKMRAKRGTRGVAVKRTVKRRRGVGVVPSWWIVPDKRILE